MRWSRASTLISGNAFDTFKYSFGEISEFLGWYCNHRRNWTTCRRKSIAGNTVKADVESPEKR